MPTTAYSYIRFSTLEQSKGDSLRRQLDASQRYIEQHLELNLVLHTTLNMRDLAVSAFRGDNATSGALGTFITAIDKGHVVPGSYLIVESLDRLSRAKVMTIALPQFTSIVNKGIIIVTLSDNNKIYSKASIKQNPLDLILSILIMIRANEESATKSFRVAQAREKKRKRATTANHKLTHNCPGWLRLNGEHDRFTVIPDRGQLIQRIYQMCLDGYGELAITKQLNKERIPTWRKSDGWQLSYIRAILDSSAVYGEFTPGKINKTKLEPIPGYFPSIISKDTFLQAQHALAQRTGKGGRPGAEVNLFSTLLRCGKCGGSIVRLNRRRTKLPIFACDKGRRGVSDCKYHPWPVSDAETLILTELKELSPPQEDTESKTIRPQQTSLSVERDRTQQQLNRLEDFAVNGGELSMGLIKRMKSMEAEIVTFNTRLSELEHALQQSMLKQKYQGCG